MDFTDTIEYWANERNISLTEDDIEELNKWCEANADWYSSINSDKYWWYDPTPIITERAHMIILQERNENFKRIENNKDEIISDRNRKIRQLEDIIDNLKNK